MPNFPNLQDVHRNQFQTDLLIAYRPAGMIADLIFPQVDVMKQTGTYPIYLKGDTLRRNNTDRAPGQPPNYYNFGVSSDTFTCTNRAVGHEVWYETLANADAPISPEQDGAEFMKDQLMLDYEVRVEAKCASGVGSSQTLTGGDAWSDYANSDPIANLRTGRQAIRATTGLRPNLAIIPQRVADVMTNHPDFIRAAFPGAGVGGMVGAAELQRIFQVDRVLIPDTVKNTGVSGGADSFTDVWSTNVYLLHVGPPRLKAAGFGFAFTWKAPDIGMNEPTNFTVYQKRDDERGVLKMWTGYHQDEKVACPELGFQIRTGI